MLFMAVTTGVSQDSKNNTIKTDSDYIIIGTIGIDGNKHTKSSIILRELDFKSGDTLLLSDTIGLNKRITNKLFNTQLFNSSELYFIPTNREETNVLIVVKERWYIWPAPIFELADRNFNEWWQDRDKESNRLEYGLRFRWENFRGRNELLKIVLQHGFTRKYEVFHTVPYINKKQTLGINYGASFSTNKQVAFRTENDKLIYHKEDSKLRNRFYATTGISSRPKYFQTHRLDLTYKNNWVGDSVILFNPTYFSLGENKQQYFELSYNYELNKADIRSYPLQGYIVDFNVYRSGLGLFDDLELTTLSTDLQYFKKIKKRFYWASKAYGKFILEEKIPYFNMRGLGYDQNFVRGFERAVIDAQQYIYTRNSIRWKFHQFKQSIDDIMPLEEFNEVPYAFYLTAFADAGYSSIASPSPLNSLNNEFLFSTGIGLDIVTYYDLVFRFEYAFTNKNTDGFFVHFEQAF